MASSAMAARSSGTVKAQSLPGSDPDGRKDLNFVLSLRPGRTAQEHSKKKHFTPRGEVLL